MLLIRKFFGLNTCIRNVIIFVLLAICCLFIYVLVSKLNILRLTNTSMRKQSLESNQKNKDDLKSDQSKPQHTKHSKIEPSMEYEKLRRRVRGNTQELWNYFSSELNEIKKKIAKDMPELIYEITNVVELLAETKRSIISDIDQMRMVDGYEEWRYEEAKSLSDLVQRRLHYLQNPSRCKNAPNVFFELSKYCGFGCQLHNIVQHLLASYTTERILVIDTKDGIYNKAGWEEFFHPVSETCLDPFTNVSKKKPFPHSTFFLPTNPYLLRGIPADLAPRLMRLHGDPFVWWIGQLFKYLLRPNDATHKMLETRMEKLGFRKPIVGIHVRRTDKIGTEANYFSIEQYMVHVEDYFLQLEQNDANVKRRVFLATDETNVIDEARRKYRSYEIFGDADVAEKANVSTRYTDSSLNGIISDIHMLSLCDYLVCTLSSNICRAAYEIMQTMHPDASNRIKSLDEIYYLFFEQNTHYVEAVLSHQPRHHNEMGMKPGDQVAIDENYWNGYSTGTNNRTSQGGLFPSFKVIEKVMTNVCPTYMGVK